MDYDRQLAMPRILLGLRVTSLCQTGRLIEQMEAAMSRHSGPYVIVKNRLLIVSCTHVIYICLLTFVADFTFSEVSYVSRVNTPISTSIYGQFKKDPGSESRFLQVLRINSPFPAYTYLGSTSYHFTSFLYYIK